MSLLLVMAKTDIPKGGRKALIERLASGVAQPLPTVTHVAGSAMKGREFSESPAPMHPIRAALCLIALLAGCAGPLPATPPISADEAHRRAIAALAANKPQEALDNYTIAAKQGDHRGERGIGTLYYLGFGVVKDFGEAVYWLTPAASASDPSSEYTLGMINDQGGSGVLQDRKKAFAWFQRAADHGHPGAAYSLGRAYHYGLGTPIDYAEAMRRYRKAAEVGNTDAMTGIGILYVEGRGVKQDFKLALENFKRAADAGNGDAMRRIGNLYFNGDGVPHNDAIAYDWLRRAAATGNEDAIRRLTTVITPDS
jgi:TPR repeat protein